MLQYLNNPDFWEFEWDLRVLVRFSWMALVCLTLLLGRFRAAVHRRILFFAFYSLAMEYFSMAPGIKAIFGNVGTSPIYNLLTPGLFFFMTFLFADLIYKGKNRRYGIALLVAFTMISVISIVWMGLAAFPIVPVGLYSIIGIFLSIGYFLNLMTKLETEYLERTPMFWVATGLIIYLSGNFLVWIGYNFMTYEKNFFLSIYRINSSLTILLHIFLGIAVLLNPQGIKHQRD